MKGILKVLGIGACTILIQTFANYAYAKSGKAAALMASPTVQTAKTFHPNIALSGCVQQAQFSNPFGYGQCKYVTMNGVNYSVAVPQETALWEIPELHQIPTNLLPQPAQPNTYITATGLTVGGPSYNCLTLGGPQVTGSVILFYSRPTKACPTK